MSERVQPILVAAVHYLLGVEQRRLIALQQEIEQQASGPLLETARQGVLAQIGLTVSSLDRMVQALGIELVDLGDAEVLRDIHPAARHIFALGDFPTAEDLQT